MTVESVRQEVREMAGRFGVRTPAKAAQGQLEFPQAWPIGTQETRPAIRPAAGRAPVSAGLSQLDRITVQAAAKNLAQQVPRPERDLAEMLKSELAGLSEGRYADISALLPEAMRNIVRDVRAGVR